MGKLMQHEDASGSRAAAGDAPPGGARAPAPPGLRSALQASLEQAEARYTPPGPASVRIEAPTAALDRDAVDAVLQLVPWPALAIDEAGEVIRCSDELQRGRAGAVRADAVPAGALGAVSADALGQPALARVADRWRRRATAMAGRSCTSG